MVVLASRSRTTRKREWDTPVRLDCEKRLGGEQDLTTVLPDQEHSGAEGAVRPSTYSSITRPLTVKCIARRGFRPSGSRPFTSIHWSVDEDRVTVLPFRVQAPLAISYGRQLEGAIRVRFRMVGRAPA